MEWQWLFFLCHLQITHANGDLVMSTKHSRALLLLFVVLTTCVGVVSSLSGCASVETTDSTQSDATIGPDGRPIYPVNDKGQTYGSIDGVVPEDEPDLISVKATNGKEGYALREDLRLGVSDPKSPEEAIANQTRREKEEITACFQAVGLPLPPDFYGEDFPVGEVSEALMNLRLVDLSVADDRNYVDAFQQLLRAMRVTWPVGV
jgi:hypothetical protein